MSFIEYVPSYESLSQEQSDFSYRFFPKNLISLPETKKDMIGKKEETHSNGLHNALTTGTVVIGNIQADTDFRLDGQVEGDITCNGKIVVGPRKSRREHHSRQCRNSWRSEGYPENRREAHPQGNRSHHRRRRDPIARNRTQRPFQRAMHHEPP